MYVDAGILEGCDAFSDDETDPICRERLRRGLQLMPYTFRSKRDASCNGSPLMSRWVCRGSDAEMRCQSCTLLAGKFCGYEKMSSSMLPFPLVDGDHVYSMRCGTSAESVLGRVVENAAVVREGRSI